MTLLAVVEKLALILVITLIVLGILFGISVVAAGLIELWRAVL